MRALAALSALAACSLLLALAEPARALPEQPFVGYHESWSETPAATADGTRLAALPAYVNPVILGFARPDLDYRGDLDLAGTGLEFPFSGRVLKEAVALLRARNPGTRVLLSVGGAAYGRWDRFDPDALARLVGDLGLDGVDLDYEPTQPDCGPAADGGWHCASDANWRRYVAAMRAALPRPALLAVPGWSVAAYGRGAWRDAPPRSPWTGNLLALFDAPEAAEIDLVSIMAYAANESLDPLESFRAYRAAWDGPLALGVMVPPDPLDGPHYGADRVAALTRAVTEDPRGGMMLYTLQRHPEGPVTRDNPDAALLAREICLGQGLPDCERPLP